MEKKRKEARDKKYDYHRSHFKYKLIPFSTTTSPDVQVLEWLEQQKVMAAYIKAVIWADMQQKQASLIGKEGKIWYAVQRNLSDDFEVGSEDLEEAKRIAAEMGSDGELVRIVEIDCTGEKMICRREIKNFEKP